jgi:predicted acyl esterase
MALEDLRHSSGFGIAVWVALGTAALSLVVAAQKDKAEDKVAQLFAKKEITIPMRDGVKLHTEIFVPRESREPLPFLLTRTPYGVTDDKGNNHYLDGSYNEFFSDGYIFVFQDIRGRYKSEGQFVMFRPPREPE